MWIQNASVYDVKASNHKDPGHNSMLIQILDPKEKFPVPKHQFKEVHQFRFMNLEEHDNFPSRFKIAKKQATAIIKLLSRALKKEMNVIVQCRTGICRSGAVTEVGVMMGFKDTNRFRLPNVMVKKLLISELKR